MPSAYVTNVLEPLDLHPLDIVYIEHRPSNPFTLFIEPSIIAIVLPTPVNTFLTSGALAVRSCLKTMDIRDSIELTEAYIVKMQRGAPADHPASPETLLRRAFHKDNMSRLYTLYKTRGCIDEAMTVDQFSRDVWDGIYTGLAFRDRADIQPRMDALSLDHLGHDPRSDRKRTLSYAEQPPRKKRPCTNVRVTRPKESPPRAPPPNRDDVYFVPSSVFPQYASGAPRTEHGRGWLATVTRYDERTGKVFVHCEGDPPRHRYNRSLDVFRRDCVLLKKSIPMVRLRMAANDSPLTVDEDDDEHLDPRPASPHTEEQAEVTAVDARPPSPPEALPLPAVTSTPYDITDSVYQDAMFLLYLAQNDHFRASRVEPIRRGGAIFRNKKTDAC